MWKNLLRKLREFLDKKTQPSQEELVSRLVLNTASLELTKPDYVELAPLKGCCGPFRLSGNSLPVIEYIVFDKTKKPMMMEFVKIRVEISKPDRIHFQAIIDADKTSDPKRHGELVDLKQAYKEPFEKLLVHLFYYFPFFRKKENALTWVRRSNG